MTTYPRTSFLPASVPDARLIGPLVGLASFSFAELLRTEAAE